MNKSQILAPVIQAVSIVTVTSTAVQSNKKNKKKLRKRKAKTDVNLCSSCQAVFSETAGKLRSDDKTQVP